MRQVALSVLQYCLGCAAAGVIGVLSAAVVGLIAWLLPRRGGFRVEMTFGAAGLVGLAMMFGGTVLRSRALCAASVLLWGWLVLPILLIPLVLAWRLVGWCRRIATKSAQ
jgi:hypothetical protein